MVPSYKPLLPHCLLSSILPPHLGPSQLCSCEEAKGSFTSLSLPSPPRSLQDEPTPPSSVQEGGRVGLGGAVCLDLHLEHKGDPLHVCELCAKETLLCSLLPTPPASTLTAAGFQENQVTAGLQELSGRDQFCRVIPGQRSPTACEPSEGARWAHGGTDSPGTAVCPSTKTGPDDCLLGPGSR